MPHLLNVPNYSHALFPVATCNNKHFCKQILTKKLLRWHQDNFISILRQTTQIFDTIYSHSNTSTKAFGVLHWFEQKLRYPRTCAIHYDSTVMMIDVDYIVIRPSTNDFSNAPVKWRNQASGKYWTKIGHGDPIAQQFDFGLVWKWESNFMKMLPPNLTSPGVHSDGCRRSWLPNSINWQLHVVWINKHKIQRDMYYWN